MDRKEFLQWCASACFLPSLLAMEGCKTIPPVASVQGDGKITVLVSDYGDRTFALIKSTQLPAPVYLSKKSDGSFTAVLLQCTHKQCELRPAPSILTCPCHGSEFSPDGKVLSPPASKNLISYPVISDTEKIIIQL